MWFHRESKAKAAGAAGPVIPQNGGFATESAGLCASSADVMPTAMLGGIMLAGVNWHEDRADPYGSPLCLTTFTNGAPWIFRKDDRAIAILAKRRPDLSPAVYLHAVGFLNRRVAEASRADQIMARFRQTRHMRDCNGPGECLSAGMQEKW